MGNYLGGTGIAGRLQQRLLSGGVSIKQLFPLRGRHRPH